MYHLIPIHTCQNLQFCIAHRNLPECPGAGLGASRETIPMRSKKYDVFFDRIAIVSPYELMRIRDVSPLTACTCSSLLDLHALLALVFILSIFRLCIYLTEACLEAFLCVTFDLRDAEASCDSSAWKRFPELAYEHSRVAMA